jgi:hypothetical protein
MKAAVIMKGFILMLMLVPALAAAPAPGGEAPGSEADQKTGTGAVFFPFIFYTPETLGGAGGSVILFNRENRSELYERNDSLAGVILYTMKNQVLFALDGKKYFYGDSLLFNPTVSLARFPNNFYGIGGGSRERDEEQYTPFYVKSALVFEVRVIERLYLGPALWAGYYELLERRRGGLVDAYYKNAVDRGVLVGPGFQLTRDTRDSGFYPRRGSSTSISGYYYRKNNLGDYEYNRYTFAHRAYVPAPLKSVLAFEVMAEAVDGSPPLDFMPRLGGDEMMRGFYKGRYSDNVYTAAQAEARVPVYGRWGMVLFAGAGDVYGRVRDVAISGLKYAGGGGVRFALNREKMINFRLDLGIAEGDVKVYFKLLEAF